MVNKVILLGRLGADPELKFTQNKMPICSLKLATNERRKNAEGTWSEHTEWHNVKAFGKTAENCAQYLKKGSQIYVDGKISTSKYQDQGGKDRYWTEIIANTVQFIGSKGKGDDSGDSYSSGKSNDVSSSYQGGFSGSVGEAVSFEDDDIPF
jgi:single-strand DNA-binding protein